MHHAQKNERTWHLEIAFIVKEENGIDNGKVLTVAESEWLYKANPLCVFANVNTLETVKHWGNLIIKVS